MNIIHHANKEKNRCLDYQNILQTCLAVKWKSVYGIMYPKSNNTCVNLKYPTCFSSFSSDFHSACHLCFPNCSHQLDKLYLRSVPEIIGELWRWSRWFTSDPFSEDSFYWLWWKEYNKINNKIKRKIPQNIICHFPGNTHTSPTKGFCLVSIASHPPGLVLGILLKASNPWKFQ